MIERRPLRCAIYTRTSTEEGLTQDYNSLAAQRDACAAYILSQKHEGWVRAKRVYDDGGYSGGNLDRPGLADLLADLAAGQIDIIVIYKIDRLTRSLRDFARLSETLDRYQASFVAVTQQFNTASSMGRLTLNILLTFAQFEREVCGDRIRDKKASSSRIGIWMGGNPALGYDAPHGKLVVNPQEAEVVRYIYRRFSELQSMAELRKDLERNGMVSKKKITQDGRDYGGKAFTWHPLRTILTNPLYRGMIRHKSSIYPGRHVAIVDAVVFDRVQTLFKQVAAREKAYRSLAYPSLLRGKIFDMAGEPLYTNHSTKVGRRHNYYVVKSLLCRRHLRNPKHRMRISAPAIEKYVIGLLSQHLRDRKWLEVTVPTLRKLHVTIASAGELAHEIDGQLERNTNVLRNFIKRIEIDKVTIRLLLDRNWLLERLSIVAPRGVAPYAGGPIEIAVNGHGIRCGNDMRVVLEDPDAPPEPDHRLVKEVLRAIRWLDALTSGKVQRIDELAEAEGCSQSLISDRIRLAFLAPDIVEAILEGRQPASMTLASLKRACPLPMSWEEQTLLLLGSGSREMP